jgi:hypothetical protein
MSMTEKAFIRKADIPTNRQIQDAIQNLGYDFAIQGDLEKRINNDGLECTINGCETYFEVYVDDAISVASQEDWIRPDLTDQDTAISFISGADYAAGACIGLISIALIDYGCALVYYMDDQMSYTREMLLTETPLFLRELKSNRVIQSGNRSPGPVLENQSKRSLWSRLKGIFK